MDPTTRDGVELLPCPFCGEAAEIEDDPGAGHYVSCGCEMTPCTQSYSSPENAAKAWNTRALAASATPQVEYDRDLIAVLLDAYAAVPKPHRKHNPVAMHQQADMLRAADNRDAAGVHTASATPQGEGVEGVVGEMFSGNAYLNVAGMLLPDGTKLYAAAPAEGREASRWLAPLGELVGAALDRDLSASEHRAAVNGAHKKLYTALTTPPHPTQGADKEKGL